MDIVSLFSKGGFFMWIILIFFIGGLFFVFERTFTLTVATVNNRRFLARVKQALSEGGVDAATEVCANTRGPVASICHAALLRVDRGINQAVKALHGAGKIEMSFLEKNTEYISFFVAAAPILGFMGTIWGLMISFQGISQSNQVTPNILADGIFTALITTLFGLVASLTILGFQAFINQKIDSLIVDMEETSTELLESLIEMKIT